MRRRDAYRCCSLRARAVIIYARAARYYRRHDIVFEGRHGKKEKERERKRKRNYTAIKDFLSATAAAMTKTMTPLYG